MKQKHKQKRRKRERGGERERGRERGQEITRSVQDLTNTSTTCINVKAATAPPSKKKPIDETVKTGRKANKCVKGGS